MKLKKQISRLIRLKPKLALAKIYSKLNSKKRRQSFLTYIKSNPTFLKDIYNINIKPNFFADFIDIDYVNININCFREYTDNVLNHRLSILGSETNELNYRDKREKIEHIDNSSISEQLNKLLPENYTFIDWQKELNTGFRWSVNTESIRISYGKNDSNDIKSVWEIGRLQFLIPVALYYKATSDERIKEEILNILVDFIANNPPHFGVNWMNSMDVGIRLVNILALLSLIGHDSINLKVQEVLKDSIYNHIKYLEEYPEWSDGMRANHYLACISSLLISSLYIENKNNFYIALNELLNEIDYQFYAKGGYFEGSSSYHRFACDMLIWAILILQKSNEEQIRCPQTLNYAGRKLKIHSLLKEPLPHNKLIEYLNQKLPAQFSFLRMIAQDKTTAMVGDSDSGFFLKMKPDFIKFNEHIFQNPDSCIEIIQLFESYFKKVEINNHYQDFGLTKVENGLADLYFRFGKLGQNGKGGHDHCDRLSILVYMDKVPFIVDSGTFNYTAHHEERNYYRSSAAHNILLYKDIEQFDRYSDDKDDLFWLEGDKAKSRIKKFDKSIVEASHWSYAAECSRSIQISEDKYIIKDTLDLDGEKVILLHLHPEIKINSDSEYIELCNKSEKIWINVFDMDYKIEEYFYSPFYGIKQKSKKIVIKSSKNEINWEIVINK